MPEAVNRYHTAKGYFQSAIMISRSPHRKGEDREMLTILSMAMLSGFALELYFKAWLIGAGEDSAVVRKFGHRLTDLFAAARAKGLPAVAQLDELVAALSPGHEDFTFRCIDDGDEVPKLKWELVFAVLDDLDTRVDAKVGASASVGLAPGH